MFLEQMAHHEEMVGDLYRLCASTLKAAFDTILSQDAKPQELIAQRMADTQKRTMGYWAKRLIGIARPR